MENQELVPLSNKIPELDSRHHGRREFIQAAAAMAGVGMAIGGTSAFAAQVRPPNTPIHQTGFTDDEVKLITENAKNLTIDDLHDMRSAGFSAVLHKGQSVQQFIAGYKTKGGLSVTATDIESIGCNYWVGVTQLSVFCRRAVGLPASRGSSRRHSTRH